ncbi:hypothetical protein J6590_042787 [Homalodisca vitripennis]|nr:hypothetical protein J6590_042787 [Homalodisca vitripennis]
MFAEQAGPRACQENINNNREFGVTKTSQHCRSASMPGEYKQYPRIRYYQGISTLCPMFAEQAGPRARQENINNNRRSASMPGEYKQYPRIRCGTVNVTGLPRCKLTGEHKDRLSQVLAHVRRSNKRKLCFMFIIRVGLPPPVRVSDRGFREGTRATSVVRPASRIPHTTRAARCPRRVFVAVSAPRRQSLHYFYTPRECYRIKSMQ